MQPSPELIAFTDAIPMWAKVLWIVFVSAATLAAVYLTRHR